MPGKNPEPLSGLQMPRFGEVATFMRLPVERDLLSVALLACGSGEIGFCRLHRDAGSQPRDHVVRMLANLPRLGTNNAQGEEASPRVEAGTGPIQQSQRDPAQKTSTSPAGWYRDPAMPGSR